MYKVNKYCKNTDGTAKLCKNCKFQKYSRCPMELIRELNHIIKTERR